MLSVQDMLRIQAIDESIRELYTEIGNLERERDAIQRRQAIVQPQASTSFVPHVDGSGATLCKKRDGVMRYNGVHVTRIDNSVNIDDITLDHVIIGEIDNKYVNVTSEPRKPETLPLYCLHFPLKSSGLKHPINADVSSYIEYFIGALNIPKRMFRANDLTMFELMEAIKIIRHNGKLNMVYDLLEGAGVLWSERIKEMLYVIRHNIRHGRMRCAAHSVLASDDGEYVGFDKSVLWTSIEAGVDTDLYVQCRTCLVIRFYSVIFNLYNPVSKLNGGSDFFVKYVHDVYDDDNASQMQRDALYRAGVMHLARMLFARQTFDMDDHAVKDYMTTSKFIATDAMASPDVDKSTKILTVLLGKMHGSRFNVACTKYSSNLVQSSRKLVLETIVGKLPVKGVLDAAYMLYPEIFLRLNVSCVRIVKCDSTKRNLLDVSKCIAEMSINEYVTSEHVICANVVHSSKHMSTSDSQKTSIDVVVSVTSRDPRTGEMTHRAPNNGFAFIEKFLCVTLMRNVGYKRCIYSSGDTESRTRHHFTSPEKMKLSVLNDRINVMGDPDMFRSTYGDAYKQLMVGHNMYGKYQNVTAAITVSYPTKSGSIMKHQFIMELD